MVVSWWSSNPETKGKRKGKEVKKKKPTKKVGAQNEKLN